MNYNDLTLQELVDLLADKTKRMVELMSSNHFQYNEEYLEVRKANEEIQKIIWERKEASDTSNTKVTAIKNGRPEME